MNLLKNNKVFYSNITYVEYSCTVCEKNSEFDNIIFIYVWFHFSVIVRLTSLCPGMWGMLQVEQKTGVQENPKIFLVVIECLQRILD